LGPFCKKKKIDITLPDFKDLKNVLL
jgi:hypothetical protein